MPFGPKSLKLNCRPVYCSRLYGILDSFIKQFFSLIWGRIVHIFLVAIDLKPKSSLIWMFLLIPDILIFFQFSKIYPSAKITTSKMLRIIEVSPVRWSCAIIFVPQKEVSYFTTLVSRNFLTFTKLQIFVFFCISINRKYYKKSNRYCTFWANWSVTENVCSQNRQSLFVVLTWDI